MILKQKLWDPRPDRNAEPRQPSVIPFHVDVGSRNYEFDVRIFCQFVQTFDNGVIVDFRHQHEVASYFRVELHFIGKESARLL